MFWERRLLHCFLLCVSSPKSWFAYPDPYQGYPWSVILYLMANHLPSLKIWVQTHFILLDKTAVNAYRWHLTFSSPWVRQGEKGSIQDRLNNANISRAIRQGGHSYFQCYGRWQVYPGDLSSESIPCFTGVPPPPWASPLPVWDHSHQGTNMLWYCSSSKTKRKHRDRIRPPRGPAHFSALVHSTSQNTEYTRHLHRLTSLLSPLGSGFGSCTEMALSKYTTNLNCGAQENVVSFFLLFNPLSHFPPEGRSSPGRWDIITCVHL